MQLTQQHIDEMKARGLDDATIQKLAASKGYTLPTGNSSVLDKITNAVTSVFAGKQVGSAIGKPIGYGLERLSEATGLPIAPGGPNGYFHQAQRGEHKYYDLNNGPTVPQVAGDAIKGATQVFGAALPLAGSIAGKVAQFGGLGAVSGVGSALADKKSLADTAQQSAHDALTGALTGLSFGVAEKGTQLVTNGLAKLGGRIQYGVIKPNAHDIADGFNVDTLKKFNLGGNLQQTASKTAAKMQSLTSELNSKLAASDATINLSKTYDDTVQSLLGKNMENFGTNSQMEHALENLRKEITHVAGGNGLVSVPEAQTVKQAAGHYGAWHFGNNTPEAKASEKVYNAFYSNLKASIEKNSPEGVRGINKQLSELIPVMNAVLRRIPVAERSGAVSLTDIISLTGATVNPSALAITLANRASKSGKVGAFLSKQAGLGQPTLQGTEQVVQAGMSH